MLVGLTALSDEIRIKFLTPNSWDKSAILYVPNYLLLLPLDFLQLNQHVCMLQHEINNQVYF